MLKLIILCPGLEHVRRGFETFSRECFDVLSQHADVQAALYKGTGSRASNEFVARTTRRDRPVARLGGRLSRTSGYYIELKVFAQRVRGAIAAQPGSVVLVNDRYLAQDLSGWRRRSGARFSLVQCNGGGDGPPFHADLVLQPRPGLLSEALAGGEPPSRHILLPLGTRIQSAYTRTSEDDVRALRTRLGLPLDRPVLLSVAALTLQKRLDYVIREVASMPSPRPFLMLLGQRQGDTKAIEGLADQLLGPHGYATRTVPPPEVSDYYRAADAFVLASLHEGLGLVLVEALAHGLPCVAHDWDGARFALGEYGAIADLRNAGALRELLAPALAEEAGSPLRAARHRYAYERFGWDVLVDRYVEVLGGCAAAQSMEAAAA